MLKKIFSVLLLMLFFVLSTTVIWATEVSEKTVIIHLFYSETCPHCKAEEIFLDGYSKAHPEVAIKRYEITRSAQNQKLFQAIGQVLQADISGVPFTVIGNQYFTGYLDDEVTGAEIEELVAAAQNDANYQDVIGLLEQELNKPQASATPTPQPKSSKDSITIPILGKVNIKTFSLPVLTFIIALLDGFNPCAMWVLLFLISMLLGMDDRRRMWVLGLTFIGASALVYFLFLAAWLNLFLFIGFIFWVRIIIAIVAISLGAMQLRSYYKNRDGGCEVVDKKKRQKLFAQIKHITQEKTFYLAIGGIILLAFAVNLIELVCSAGLPAIYTNVLAMSHLPWWQYYAYLVFYIIIFMLDDMVIFVIAMKTLHAVGIESKYARLSKLIGGTVIFLIGILMLFKPELLMFG
ncbi:hypothetical protein GYA49_00035 [Candidatus Beckwithbacteria bacterium]|nr:hypothetical protein [Candidatus Beckwithbacteria bacterium]